MSFADPRLLWLLLLAPAAAAGAAWLWRRRLAADAAWAARGLWDRLLPAYSPRRLAFSVASLALVILTAALALARPRWGSGEQKVERRGVDVVFLVDSSLSMGALDVPPSRLFVAKSLVRRMAREMPGNRVGLVQTEGDGVVLAPLTLDGAVLDLLLDTIDPGSLPTPGTELATGLETSLRLFGEGGEKHRALVVLSDGEDHGGGLDSEIGRLREEGVVVFAFGIGTPEGAPVPIPGASGEFKRDADGSVVMSQLHEDLLENLARASGGSYLRVTSAAADPVPMLRRIDRLEKKTIESQTLSALEERFQWPLGLAVLALLLHLAVGPFKTALAAPALLSRRRPGSEGSRAVAARVSLLPTLALLGWAALPSLPWQVHLPTWAERWLYNPRERTERSIVAYRKGRARDAVRPADTASRLAPEDPIVQFDAGTAHLAAGHGRRAVPLLEKAAEAAGAELSSAAHYNLGNARLATGDAAGAVEAYKQVLRAEPGNENAKFNLELALREEQKQGMGPRGRPAGSRGHRSPNRDPANRQGKGKADQSQEPPDQRRPPTPQQQGQPRPGDQGESRQGGQERDDRLPQFRNQPEMSAREAASVLSAVENLERQQRRDQAARRARQRSAKGKDW
ncbi:MAG TPA: VWA domain-containing protein [Thermoanaerobaculia bacterium]|jgi:Ca-activated chloride channel family protein|nr:VWA domain-containing protein [Thermoanaerobaculia bacterium]